MGTQRRIRLLSALAAVLAAAGLVVIPPGGGTPARAAGEDSAVTVEGKCLHLDANNVCQGDDFRGLKVTVHQTKELRGQGVLVTWSGGKPTGDNFSRNFLQIMQCWGDATTGPEGPDRTHCQYGVAFEGLAGDTSLDYRRAYSDDPADPEKDKEFIPFQPVTGDPTTERLDFTYYNRLNTNEVPFGLTGPDGTGQAIFEVQSQTESPHLGCGLVEEGTSTPRPCWLVIVPRGEYEADGTKIGNSTADKLLSSPLSISNWDQRMVVKLDFQPADARCDLGKAERQTVGTELVADAMAAWQPALCSAGVPYTYIKFTDVFARGQVLSPTEGGAGLGFVMQPAVPASGAPVVHAPVAVSGLVIAANIQSPGSSTQMPPFKLTPRLVAKLLTYSYHHDVPGPSRIRLPDGSEVVDPPHGDLNPGNPALLTADPEFLALNPAFKNFSLYSWSAPHGLIVPQGNPDYIRTVWRWLRSDKEARDFLSGKPDPWGTTINPHFLALNLADDTEISEFPKADPTKWENVSSDTTIPCPPELSIDSVAWEPYASDLYNAGLEVRRGNAGGKSICSPGAQPPSLKGDIDPPGRQFQFALVDTPTAERYGLTPAQICNPCPSFTANPQPGASPSASPSVTLNPGAEWVTADPETLTKTVEAMRPGQVPGVLDQDPGVAPAGAYPLATVTYAAASTGLDPQARADYANLISYAAGPGQEPGVGAGLLPPGYAPMPASMREQAAAAAAELVRGVSPSSPAGTADTSGGSDTAGGLSPGANTGGAGTPSGTPDAGSSPSAAAAVPATASAAGSPTAVAQAGPLTPDEFAGFVRWLLLAVLLLGALGVTAGPFLLRLATVKAAASASTD